MRQKLLSELSEILDGLGVLVGTLKEETNLEKDLGMDSLDKVEFIMQVEKKYNLAVPDDVAVDISDIKGCLDFIEGNMK